LCKGDRCRWFHEPHPRSGRKCYYGPQCILGWLDLLLHTLKLAFKRWLPRG